VPAELTQAELARLEASTNEEDWNAACDAVKRARKGIYPDDWFAKVIATGLLDRIAAKWGGGGSRMQLDIHDFGGKRAR
jgi:hypothetical protein